VTEGLDRDARWRGGVGEHEVHRIDSEVRQELLHGLVLVTDQPDGQANMERRFEEAADDRLWQDVRDADREPQGPLGAAAALERLHQLGAEAEDLLRVAVHDAASLRQDDVAPRTAEELLLQCLFEGPDLSAHRRLRDVQPLAGSGHASFARRRPEIAQVVVIQPFHVGT
jgi:hypothetical protein